MLCRLTQVVLITKDINILFETNSLHRTQTIKNHALTTIVKFKLFAINFVFFNSISFRQN